MKTQPESRHTFNQRHSSQPFPVPREFLLDSFGGVRFSSSTDKTNSHLVGRIWKKYKSQYEGEGRHGTDKFCQKKVSAFLNQLVK